MLSSSLRTVVFSLQAELQVHYEWRGCSCDGEAGKHEIELRVEVEMEWVASVPTACSVLARLTRLELKIDQRPEWRDFHVEAAACPRSATALLGDKKQSSSLSAQQPIKRYVMVIILACDDVDVHDTIETHAILYNIPSHNQML